MDAITTALREQHEELDALLAGLDDAGWARPVPDCPGWSVADVVLHLAQTDELVVSAADGGFAAAAERVVPGAVGETVDDTVGRMVAHQRGAPGPAVHARWRAAASTLREVLAASDPRRPMPWVVTDLPARTMATTRLSECWIHTHDVAVALGVALVPGDRLRHVARLAVRTVPYAFARAGLPAPGPVAARLTAPDGSTWHLGDDDAPTVVTGSAADFCLVAARRLDPAAAEVRATGPGADDVLRLVRTYA
ncbi:maleylpyruvate isomerase family mycothiol-dependent enzyme [Pseudonocardia hydrocarbonoxydans]|uniref:TIGR03084 family protein n=1 Tax=Pseudonocardia hydrocarbonoxydans TaxID=76726 RepID=A0A4Y3WVQ9_9PSEU|nr:maleylpyruvate isomerase family mycothiol-dependent enzyme [Pseudonocardia hydrocarbonoxydans]GEC22668.1 TIGR03084 family protein [Pseudonocardia hydrocarbonoxydans]